MVSGSAVGHSIAKPQGSVPSITFKCTYFDYQVQIQIHFKYREVEYIVQSTNNNCLLYLSTRCMYSTGANEIFS